MVEGVAQYRWIAGEEAFGAPGASPRWTSSTKDLVGTAYSASSRVWWTTSHGILNEIYYPTIDRPQMRDMELLFSDGETFFHEEKRDFSYEIALIDPLALAVRITCTANNGKYKVVKQLLSDPHYPAVLMHCKIEGDEEFLSRLKVYGLLAPHLEMGGAGNSARAVMVNNNKILMAWKGDKSLAFGVKSGDEGFSRVSCGFVGQSDGWQDLHDNCTMDWEFSQALNGNIALMGEIPLSKSREFTVGIGFGEGHHAALAVLLQSLGTPILAHRTRFIEQWHRVVTPDFAEHSRDGGKLLRLSHSMLLTHEDKTFAGAFIASASIPWGQAKGDEDLGGYHLVWTRDMTQTAGALLACGKTDTAQRALTYLAVSQQPDGGFAQNFWVNGTPYWGGIQLDEVGAPIILAWRLWKMNALKNVDLLPFVTHAASYLVRQAPVTQQERWEECPGYSPSTLAVVITALTCAADMTREQGDTKLAEFFQEQADWIESNLEKWTVTENGELHPEIRRYYMRIRPPMCGDTYALPNCQDQMLHIANRGPGEQTDFEARNVVDAGFLELVRYGVRAADDPLIVDSVKVVDAVLKRMTPRGPVWRRYNHDGYGQGHDGSPFIHWGQGRGWPLLVGERAHYEIAAGNDPAELIATFERYASAGGMYPEQVWDAPDLPAARMFCGAPSGSAMPLVWAHAEYIKLMRSTCDRKVWDRVDAVAERYQKQRGRKDLEVWKERRHVDEIEAGKTLRVISARSFEITWTLDNWKTTNKQASDDVGPAGSFADVRTGAGQTEPILFTLYWPKEDRWEGVNYTVKVTPVAAGVPHKAAHVVAGTNEAGAKQAGESTTETKTRADAAKNSKKKKQPVS
jgi:glucoamylase